MRKFRRKLQLLEHRHDNSHGTDLDAELIRGAKIQLDNFVSETVEKLSRKAGEP